MQKQLEGTQKYINEQSADRVAHIDGQPYNYCRQYTRASGKYKYKKVIKPSNPFTDVAGFLF